MTQQHAEATIQQLRQQSQFKEGYHQGLHFLRFFPWSVTLKEEVAFCCFWQDDFSRGLDLLNEISLDDVHPRQRKDVEGRLVFNKQLFESRLSQPSPVPIITLVFDLVPGATIDGALTSVFETCEDLDLVHRWTTLSHGDGDPQIILPSGHLLEPITSLVQVVTPFAVIVRQPVTTRFSVAQLLEVLESEPMLSDVMIEHPFQEKLPPTSFLSTTRFGTEWLCWASAATIPLSRMMRVRPEGDDDSLHAVIVCHSCFEGVTIQPPRFKSFVINLDKRSDRMSTMEQQRDLLPPFERVSAVDGLSLKTSPRLRALCSRGDYKMRPGVIGCALSHLKLYKKLLQEEEEIDGYVVFEDDVDVPVGFVDRMNRMLALASATQTGLVFLTSVPLRPGTPYSQTGLIKRQPFMWSEVAGGTGCYYISKDVARTVLEHVDKNGIDTAIDMILMFRIDVGQRFCLPPIITQFGVDPDSDIQHDHHITSHLMTAGDEPVSQFKIFGPDGAMDFDDEVEAP